MKKITAILMLGLSAFLANAEEIKLKPGSILSIYQLERDQTFIDDEMAPINTVLDRRTQSFALADAFKANKELNAYSNTTHLASLWSGFIEIKEAGIYVFSMQDEGRPSYAGARIKKTYLLINDKECVVVDTTARNMNAPTIATKTVKFDPGFYKIDVIRCHPDGSYNKNGYGYGPTITYWNKLSPIKKTVITPSTLMYR